MKISAIILSAGKSERMGELKPLLKINSSTFIETIIENLKKAGIEDIVVVLGYKAEEIEPYIPSDVKSVKNEDYEKGQLSSLKMGLMSLPQGIDGFLVVLVDNPLVKKETYSRIIDFLNKGAQIVLPKYKGKRGHPVGFRSVYKKELLNAPLDIGARFVIKNNRKSITEISVQDEGVIININTKKDYKRLITNNH